MLQNFVIDHIVGCSPWVQRVRKRILQVAGYRYSALITGPSGTGKELVARAIHNHGPRKAKPFIPVNCAAIPGGLFSSQLFGHAKGAFTGAQYASLGCFRAAEEGTIFLDEVGEMDLDSQAKLLRVLQERIVTPVGSHDGVPVDVRVIAATNRDLEEEVKAGRFRLDLYYRLNVLAVETLGLSERPEDIEVLATHFLAKTTMESGLSKKQLSPSALALLKTYSWPGNVRQLQNMIERAVVFAEGDTIEPEAFPQIPRPQQLPLSQSPLPQPALSQPAPQAGSQTYPPAAPYGTPGQYPPGYPTQQPYSYPNPHAGPSYGSGQYGGQQMALQQGTSVAGYAPAPQQYPPAQYPVAQPPVMQPPVMQPRPYSQPVPYQQAAAYPAMPAEHSQVEYPTGALDASTGNWPSLEDVEREHIRKTLHETYYNQSAAARLLNIDRKLLARKIRKYNLEVPQAQRGRPRTLPRS